MIPTTVQDRVLAITACFESRSGFDTVSGNDDGMLLRAGLMRWSLGMATLQPLLKEMLRRSPELMLEHLGTVRGRMLEALSEGKFPWRDAAVELTGAQIGARVRNLLPEWHAGIAALMRSEVGVAVQREAMAPQLASAHDWCREYGVETVRGLSLFLDIRVQHGGIEPHCKARIIERLRPPMSHRERLTIVAEECVAFAAGRRRGGVLSRKLCIINGKGEVEGRTYDLAREFGLSDAAVSEA